MIFKKQLLTAIVLAFVISISSCTGDQAQQKAQIQKIPVVKVIEYDVPIISEYVGQIYGAKDIPIRARVEGFLETMDFNEGSKVTKGQLLYTIDPQSLKAASNAQKSEVVSAQTALTKAKADLDRIKPLAEANAISKSELDAAQASYDAAIAGLNAAKSNLKSSDIELSYTKVLSPIDGVIGKTMARVGEFVGKDPNPVILNTVSSVDTIIVKFSVTEAQYLTLARQFMNNTKKENLSKARDKSEIELQLADESIYSEKGMIDFIDRNIDDQTGSILVQASFPNPNGLLRPGMYSKVRLRTGILKNSIVIPQRCISEIQGEFSVFILGDSNKVVRKPITIGTQSGDLAAVTEGLSPNDRIVIDAIQKVRNGIIINPLDTVFHSKVFKGYNKAFKEN